MSKETLEELFLLLPPNPSESLRAYTRRACEDANVINWFIEKRGEAYTHNTLRTTLIRRGLSTPFQAAHDKNQYKTEDISTDKATSEFSWRTIIDGAETFKQSIKTHSKSQDTAVWQIKTKRPICVALISDLHIGSWGTDHAMIKTIIDEIINTPDLYIILAGDLTQMAIKMRSVAEVSDNLLPPKWQYKVLESIMKDIKHKVIAATWENHAAEREEKQIGYSPTAMMLEDNVIYFSGIGHLKTIVGNQTYNLGVSHVFRGRSMYNGVHAQMRYMRMEAPFLDVCMAGDSHVPALHQFIEGGKMKVALNAGSTQIDSSYAKRYFSLTTSPVFPCFTLDPKDNLVTPFFSVKAWLKAKK